jgi:hypothetical protein
MLRRLLFCFRALALLVRDAVGRFAGGLAGCAALAATAAFRGSAQIPRDYSFNSAHLKHSLKFFSVWSIPRRDSRCQSLFLLFHGNQFSTF